MATTNRATARRKPSDVFMSPPVANDDTFGDISELIEEMTDDHDARVGAAHVLEEIAGAQAEHALGLQMLRATFGLTQTELAGALGISQANVAQTEQRGDMLVSTLRRYVETITGGELRLLVMMPGRPPLEFNLAEVGGAASTSERPRRKVGSKVRATTKPPASARAASRAKVTKDVPEPSSRRPSKSRSAAPVRPATSHS